MAEKHIVVQGGTCQCKFSVEPKTDVLKVNTQSMHYANDKEGKEKLIATDKDIGQTLDKNTFGKCKMQPNGSGDFLPCQAVITQWSDFYDKVTLSNQGKILLEDSKATCPIGGPDCITIKNHGQTGEGSQQQAKESDTVAQNQANPVFADFNDNQTQAKAEEKPQGPEEKREIVKVVPEDIDGKVIPKGEKYHYGKVVNVVVHTTGMVGELVHVELWEDDAIGAGHSDENRYNKVMEQFAFVGEKGVAEVRFVIQNAYRSIAVTHNAKEGKTHEYYFMVYAPQVINTSGNINIYAPEYVEEKKRVIEEKLKGIEPKPVQEPKQKIKAEAPKIVVPAKVATPKPAPKPAAPAAPAAVVPKKITYIYFTDDKGNKITNSDYGNTIRATIGSTGLVGHTVKLRVYDKEWLGDPHLLTKDPIVKTITSNLCYVEIPLTEAMKKLGGNMWYDDVYVDIEIVETKAHIKSQSITVDTNRFSFDLPDNETKIKVAS
uniref:DUF4280 domain-containing protein n=1 Tax=Flavobacterium sp. TaxID=239 RepID=UPI00286DE83E